jgi:hypothetical protein
LFIICNDRENSEEKASLEKLKKELETKANALIKQEKDLKEKQKRLSKDQEVFKVRTDTSEKVDS